MRVLWFSVTPSLYEEKKYGGWVASLERIITNKCPDINLGIAFEHPDGYFKKEKNGVVYYPINVLFSWPNRLRVKVDCRQEWRILKQSCRKIIDDFKPDIIQCFGSEWPFSAIAEDLDIPVVVHMQGFTNVYNLSAELAMSFYDYKHVIGFNPLKLLSYKNRQRQKKFYDQEERKRMRINSYYMGRTEWDKNIVEHYSPNANYYYCPEAIRPEIYEAKNRWKLPLGEKLKIVTITQAGRLKGNEIILRTAEILKKQFCVNFEWVVAGNKQGILEFEKKTGIKAEDVNVKPIGMIGPNEIAEILSTSHMYIHPAIIDNSPNSLCEAQLIGCPVIAAYVGGIPQLVDNDITGLLYPYNEVHTLAFKIMDLYNDFEKMKRISSNEMEAAKKRHDPDLIADVTYKIYVQCIKHFQDRMETEE